MTPMELISWIVLAKGNAAPVSAPNYFLWGSLLAIGLLFYFMMMRPEARKRKQLEEMLHKLKKNDRVVTVGGIFGTVAGVQKGSDEITLKVDESSNTKLRVLRSHIARVLTDEKGDDQ